MLATRLAAKTQRRHQRRTVRRSSMKLMLEGLESRVLLAGTPTQLLTQSILPSPYTSVGAAPSSPIIVAVADATGAIVTTDNSTVVMLTLAVNPAGGSLTTFTNGSWRAVGSVTATAAAGIATFSNFSFSVPGQYLLNIFDSRGALSGTQSSLFTVLAMATQLVFSVQPGDITAGTTFAPNIQVSVRDATGALVTTDTREIRLSLNSTAGTLTGGTVTNAVGGIATFTGLSEIKTGTFALQARDSSTTGALTQATSINFTVSAGSATNLVFEQQPPDTLQGESFGTIVDVTDNYGNLVTADTSTVTLTVAQPIGTSLGGTTSVGVSNGKAIFSGLFLGQPNDYRLQATDVSPTGTLTATSNLFAIIGPAAQLAFVTLPTQTTMGQIMSPGVAVEVQDARNHRVTSDTSSIVMTATGPGTLSGTTTVQAINGSASFTDLSFSAMGTYTLQANDGTLTGAVSPSFIINGTAAQLAFLVEPTAPSSNTVITPPVVVEVEDIAGNRVVDATDEVVISKASGPGNLNGTIVLTAVNGLATFSNLKLTQAGTYTLAAASGILTGAVTHPFVVLPAASKVVFVTQPSEVASGATMYPAVVVQIQNELGDVATTNTSAVTLSILRGPDNGTIGGSITVTAVAGVATFKNLVFGVTGQYVLVASDGALATDTSQVFAVTPPPTKLVWGVQPITVRAGNAMRPLTVVVKNRNNEIVSSSHVVVTLTISSGPTGGSLTLNGSTVANASTNANHGIATFSGLSFTKSGSYILNAASTGLTAMKSQGFGVTVDATSAHLVIASSPTSTLVGRIFASKVFVDVQDQFGNVVTNAGSPITLFISSGTGGILSGHTTLSANKGVAVFGDLRISQAGSYAVTASDGYLPDTTPATFSVTVTPVVSSVRKHSTARVSAGTDFTLTSQLKGVKSSSVPWTGTVSLVTSDGVELPTTSQVSANGRVNLAVAGQTAGTYTVRLNYEGDINHLGASSPEFQMVVGGSTTTRVTYTVTGTTLNLNVNVTGRGTTARTGTVELLENGTVNSTAVLSNSRATFTFDPSIGKHTYTVAYPGDINFRGSASRAVKVSIGLHSSTKLTSPDTTLHVGDTLTLNVLVNPATGSPAPSGFVQLLEHGTTVQTTTLDGSAGAVFTLAPTLGTHTYAVAYEGDNHYLTSQSRSLRVTVGREGTTVDLTPSPSELTFGETLTLNASVLALNDAVTARTGLVVLKEGSSVLATMTLNSSSSAALTVTPRAGAHTYSVAYLGDHNFLSSSAKLSLTVAQDGTTVTATPSAESIAAGTIFSIGTAVAPVSAAGLTPTGMVQLQEDGATVLALSLNSSGTGTFYLTPPAGNHTYTLVYLGDANFESSVSSEVHLTVTG